MDDGLVEGTEVGWDVGDLLGIVVGIWDGSCVGDMEGLEVGDNVG